MNEHVRRNFEMYFPSLAKQMTTIRSRGYDEYLVCLDDGTSVIYDDCDYTIRRTPVDSENMTEVEYRREFGNRLNLIMYRKGISQTQLSALTGIPQPLISNYIRGKMAPSFYKVDKIAKALGCTTDDLRFT